MFTSDDIEVFTQSSIRITDRGRHIYLDPYQMREEPRDADFILITHDHYDHFSPEDIAKVTSGESVLIIPEKMTETAQQVAGSVGKIVTIAPGTYHDIDGLEFDTVPAYNVLKPFHPKASGWVGYILHCDGARVYVSGDTDATKEARDVRCDIACVPIGGTYTMDARKAAELINNIKPRIAIPTHYGSIVGKKEDADIFAAAVCEPVRVEVKMKY